MENATAQGGGILTLYGHRLPSLYRICIESRSRPSAKGLLRLHSRPQEARRSVLTDKMEIGAKR